MILKYLCWKYCVFISGLSRRDTIIVNFQLSIVNSAKPFKHQFVGFLSETDKHYKGYHNPSQRYREISLGCEIRTCSHCEIWCCRIQGNEINSLTRPGVFHLRSKFRKFCQGFISLKRPHTCRRQMWGLFWQRMRDSNPRERSQSPVCYRYTNPLWAEQLYYTQFPWIVKR